MPSRLGRALRPHFRRNQSGEAIEEMESGVETRADRIEESSRKVAHWMLRFGKLLAPNDSFCVQIRRECRLQDLLLKQNVHRSGAAVIRRGGAKCHYVVAEF